MALKPTPMAKVMAEGAEELKMGRLNLFNHPHWSLYEKVQPTHF